MNYYNNPYGIDRMKEKEKLENERMKKMESAMMGIVAQLRNIGERLEKIEKKI